MEKINVQFTKDHNPKSGFSTSIGWEQLRNQSIDEAVNLQEHEKITGLVVSFHGVQVCIEKV